MSQKMWAMVDEKGYIYPHYIRHLKSDVVDALNEGGDNKWAFMQSIGRRIVKIKVKLQ